MHCPLKVLASMINPDAVRGGKDRLDVPGATNKDLVCEDSLKKTSEVQTDGPTCQWWDVERGDCGVKAAV